LAVAILGPAALAPAEIRQADKTRAVNTADLDWEKYNFMVSRSLKLNKYTVNMQPGLPSTSAGHNLLVCALDTQIVPLVSKKSVAPEYIGAPSKLQTCALTLFLVYSVNQSACGSLLCT
jgi:hypothetical protein